MAKSKLLKDRVHDAILQDLIQGLHKPGDVLNEKQLIEKHGVSKSPVRDALVALCNENVLRSIPRYGYEVVEVSDRLIREILAFRRMLEVECMREGMAAGGGLDALYALIREGQSEDGASEQSVFEHWDKNSRFHLSLCLRGGNSYCADALSRSLATLKRAYAQYYWNRMRRFTFTLHAELHEEILNVLRDGDFDRAQALLVSDIDAFLAYI